MATFDENLALLAKNSTKKRQLSFSDGTVSSANKKLKRTSDSSSTLLDKERDCNKNHREQQEQLEPQELAKRRRASRESSRRTRERERKKLEFFKANKMKLEGDNEKFRAENERLRRLIQLIKDEESKKYSSLSVVQQPPQLEQILVFALLSNCLVANSPPTTAAAALQQQEDVHHQSPIVVPAQSGTTVGQSQLLSILSSLISTTKCNSAVQEREAPAVPGSTARGPTHYYNSAF